MIFKMYTNVEGWRIEFRFDLISKRPAVRVTNIQNPMTRYFNGNAVIMAKDLLPDYFWPEFAKILIDEQNKKFSQNPPNQESLL